MSLETERRTRRIGVAGRVLKAPAILPSLGIEFLAERGTFDRENDPAETRSELRIYFDVFDHRFGLYFTRTNEDSPNVRLVDYLSGLCLELDDLRWFRDNHDATPADFERLTTVLRSLIYQMHHGRLSSFGSMGTSAGTTYTG